MSFTDNDRLRTILGARDGETVVEAAERVMAELNNSRRTTALMLCNRGERCLMPPNPIHL